MSMEENIYNNIKSIQRSRAEARKHYDKISGIYDYVEGAFEKKYRNMALDHLVIKPGEKVLEIGFGTGHALKDIADRVGLEGKVVGIDISLEMCRISRERLLDACYSKNTDLICADAVQIPLKNHIFDKIFMSFTLELFSEKDIVMVLKEAKRVLKTGGKICVVSLFREEAVFVEIYEIFHDIFPRILDCRPIYPKKTLEDVGFNIQGEKREKMGVLPIQIVTAIS